MVIARGERVSITSRPVERSTSRGRNSGVVGVRSRYAPGEMEAGELGAIGRVGQQKELAWAGTKRERFKRGGR